MKTNFKNEKQIASMIILTVLLILSVIMVVNFGKRELLILLHSQTAVIHILLSLSTKVFQEKEKQQTFV